MLIGQYTSNINNKRRVSIPAKFRKELGSTFILTRWYEDCLALVEKTKWDGLVSRLIAEKKGITKEVRDTDRFLYSMAYELEPDEQGRVVVPDNLASYAKLGQKIVFIGLGDRVEVWDEKAWREKESRVVKDADKFIDTLAKK